MSTMTVPADHLDDREKLDWIRLIRSERIGPITFHQLIARYGDAASALEALPGLARRGGRRSDLRICPVDQAEQELEHTRATGAEIVAACEPAYPGILREIADPPPVIAVKGDASLLSRPAVAVVGARNASASGTRFAHRLAGDLGAQGLMVASGLARGVDAAAHQGALTTGTIAVVGGGVDVVYPAENAGLYDQIAEQGVIVAEPPVGTQPKARHFPRRNRIISGLVHGVVVVEAAVRSGSLITARMALEQGREVFAVPGSPLDPRARGTNRLIKQGAALCEDANDVMDALLPQLDHKGEHPVPKPLAKPEAPAVCDGELKDARGLVAEKLSPSPIDIDELVRQTQLTPAALLTILLEFELAGRLTRHPGNRVSAG